MAVEPIERSAQDFALAIVITSTSDRFSIITDGRWVSLIFVGEPHSQPVIEAIRNYQHPPVTSTNPSSENYSSSKLAIVLPLSIRGIARDS